MKYKDFEFVRRCIRSCKTYKQLSIPISNLIRLFNVKHDDRELVDLLYEEKNNHRLYRAIIKPIEL